jgi:hypothetical protein
MTQIINKFGKLPVGIGPMEVPVYRGGADGDYAHIEDLPRAYYSYFLSWLDRNKMNRRSEDTVYASDWIQFAEKEGW